MVNFVIDICVTDISVLGLFLAAASSLLCSFLKCFSVLFPLFF